MACALWAFLALCGLFMRDHFLGVLLIWAPSGVAVAAFRIIPRTHWPHLAGIFLPVQALAVALSGVPLITATAYAVSAIVQAGICAELSRLVLGSRTSIPRRHLHVVGMFGAATAACLIGAAIALPFLPEQTVEQFAIWFLANVLGILIVAPAVVQAHRLISGQPTENALSIDRELIFSVVGCAVLALFALQVTSLTLMTLLVAAMIGMAVRYGHPAVPITLLTYVVVATSLSLGGHSPMPQLSAPPSEASLVLQSWMLTMLATALPLTTMLIKREDLQIELIRRNSVMHENLMMLDLGEQLAGLGRWRVDLVTGEQDWSSRMLELHGLPEELGPDPGDVRHLLPDGIGALFRKIVRKREEREPFSFDYRIKPPDSTERILRISVLNEFDMDGRRVAIFGAAMDVTEQVHRERALDLARARAMRLAAEAQELANTDPLTNLPNRRCTFGRLDSMVEVAHKRGSVLTAIILDIDHFKAVNDAHGHQMGDEVIVQVAELARRQARQADVVGRIGGEEFVWLLPGIDASSARALAERLRRSVERGIEGSSLPKVTISVGVAQIAQDDRGDDLLARADAALYQAKEAGRNQVHRAA